MTRKIQNNSIFLSLQRFLPHTKLLNQFISKKNSVLKIMNNIFPYVRNQINIMEDLEISIYQSKIIYLPSHS
jgi:hypothetical protein